MPATTTKERPMPRTRTFAPTYTFHAFGDEWLWQDPPNDDLPITSHDEALALAAAQAYAEEIAAATDADGKRLFPREEVFVRVTEWTHPNRVITARDLADGDDVYHDAETRTLADVPRTPENMKFGVPYAPWDLDALPALICVCPECGARIPERADADGETQTQNYARHYIDVHENA